MSSVPQDVEKGSLGGSSFHSSHLNKLLTKASSPSVNTQQQSIFQHDPNIMIQFILVLSDSLPEPLRKKNFEAFLKVYGGSDLLRFVDNVEVFKNFSSDKEEPSPTAKALDAEKQILDDFIKNEGTLENLLSNEAVERITTQIETDVATNTPKIEIFDEAADVVKQYLFEGPFLKFLYRSHFTNISEKHSRFRRILGSICIGIGMLIIFIGIVADNQIGDSRVRFLAIPFFLSGYFLYLTAQKQLCPLLGHRGRYMGRTDQSFFWILFSEKQPTEDQLSNKLKDESTTDYLRSQSRLLFIPVTLLTIISILVGFLLPPNEFLYE